jgi:hypothetical protein
MFVKEPLNGGVVQTRHSTLLRPGEVQAADDCILRPGDPALYKAPGRTAYGTVRSTSISTTTNGTTALASTAAFGTDIAAVTVTAGGLTITKAAAFGSVQEGQTIVGVGIPAGTFVQRVVDTSNVEMSSPATAGGTVTITFSDLYVGTFITGTGITPGTTIASITNASNLVMSAAASDSTTVSRTFSEIVRGLRVLNFDTETPVLAALAASKLYTSPLTTLTGSFSALISNLSQQADATLETVHIRDEDSGDDRHIILTGFDVPRVIYYKDGGAGAQALTTRALGMKPVTDFVGATVVTGSWSSLVTFQTGYYWFLVTEVFNADQPDEVESTFIGEPKYTRVTDYTTQSIRVTRNPRVNDGLYGNNLATHWRIYMAPKQADAFPAPDLSSYRRMATVSTGVGTPPDDTIISQILTDISPWQAGWARTFATVPGFDSLFPSGATSALSTVALQTVTSSVVTNTSTQITHGAAGFATVTEGMSVVGVGIPQGATVVRKDSSTVIYISQAATASGTVSLFFGNKPTWDGLRSLVPANQGNYRAGYFQDFGIQNQSPFSTMTVTGIKVEINGMWTSSHDGGDRGFYVQLIKGNPASATATSPERWVQFTVGKLRQQTISLGGTFDTWGVAWAPADFIDGAATFTVRLRKHASAVEQTHYIDGIRVTFYGGGTTLNLDGDSFKTIILSDQLGTSFGVGAAGSPPVASTADMFDGMVVMNDTKAKSTLVGAIPGDPEAYPVSYRLPIDGVEIGEITVFRRLGNVGIVGGENAVVRLNYYPRESDADFSKGRCYEPLATDHGMVGPRSSVRVSLPGRGEVLVYLPFSSALRWTDGVTTLPLNEDIDWPNLIEPTLIHRSHLEVYPKLFLIALYYVPLGGTRKTKVMYFSYHPSHIKPGFKLPAVGPVSCVSGSAAASLLSGQSRLFTGHGIDGKVYVEDNGATDDSGGTIFPSIRTRRYVASEIGREGRVERFFVIADQAGDATTGGFTARMYRQNQGEALTAIHDMTESNTAIGGIIELFPDDSVETFEVGLFKSGAQTSALRLHYLCFDAPDQGQDTNG